MTRFTIFFAVLLAGLILIGGLNMGLAANPQATSTSTTFIPPTFPPYVVPPTRTPRVFSVTAAPNPELEASHLLRRCQSALYNEYDYELALDLCTQAIELTPNNSQIYLRRAEAYIGIGRYSLALVDLNRALELDPDSVGAYMRRADTYVQLGDNERALADVNQVIEMDSEDDGGYWLRGQIYEFRGEYGLAVSDFTLAIENQPEPLYQMLYFVERGWSYLNLDEYDSALADLTYVIEYEVPENSSFQRVPGTPQLTTAYWVRGWTYYELENYDASLADFTEGITRRPNDPRCYEGRGYTYYQMKTYDLALVDLRRYVELAGDNARLETLHLIETIEGLSM
jgi:tetratricopeptide (TPR) repeat protein